MGTAVTAGDGAVAGATRYEQLLALLDAHGASYREVVHASEGRTDVISGLRGHALERAAKCLVLLVKLGKKRKRYVVAVVPGDRRVDIGAVRTLLGATWVGVAPSAAAEERAGSPVGTVLPFSFSTDLELIADPALLDGDELWFNAARLDRSLALATADWQRIAQPRMAHIAAAARGPAADGDGAAGGQGASAPGSARVDGAARTPVVLDGAPDGGGDPEAAYDINLDLTFGALERIDVTALAAACASDWHNQSLVRVNDCVVRLGVLHGDFHWHTHEAQDEFFYVVDGRWVIELPDRTVELSPGQAFTVPRGIAHFPRAPERTVLLMIEGAGVVPTGG